MQDQVQRQWVVMKFGGTSVSSRACWQTIGAQAYEEVGQGRHVMIVVSALSGVTNLLTQLITVRSSDTRSDLMKQIHGRHEQLLNSLDLEPGSRYLEHRRSLEELVRQCPSPPEPSRQARILAHGELMSSAIGQQVLTEAGLEPNWLDARDLLKAHAEFASDPLAARCVDHPEPALQRDLSGQATLHITQGFIAGGPRGSTCLLGRGGSDTSAAALAAILNAAELQIWTDVPGIFSADPRTVPEARLLTHLSYSEAQELASMGARVLHPPSIQPARRHQIPVVIKDTGRPAAQGTRIGRQTGSEEAQVKGVVSRDGITLISMDNPSMWRQPGFMADAFAVFKRHGYSVDLVSTSESTVTVSLDPQVPAHGDAAKMAVFLRDLEQHCRVTVTPGCMSISLVGNSIRTILGRLSAALDIFQDRRVHMVTQSANDLNLTLVVDPEHGVGLVRKLHQLLIASTADSLPGFGPAWNDLARGEQPTERREPWWVDKSAQLEAVMEGRQSAYVYDLDTARNAARKLLGLESVSRVFYAIKANDHPDLLAALVAEGLGLECVSMEEVRHVRRAVPDVATDDILFTPNFAPREEYEAALQQGIRLTVDNFWVIRQWPELFEGRQIFLRLDLDTGYGHHKKVITSGADSKFGISLDHINDCLSILQAVGARVVGLHAHTGSGVHNAEVWREQLEQFLAVLPQFPDVRVLDLGGGLGVPERRGQAGFDLSRMDALLAAAIKGRDIEIWLEPGRYLSAECGVLLSRVTQLKAKGRYNYLGINTGMNALIRPALYGAYHDIVNLSRLQQAAEQVYRVVGPICESGDVVGEGRLLPASTEGDIMLIANAGAYGRVMSSGYNRRFPPEELFI